MHRAGSILSLTLVFVYAATHPVYAYIDPGSSSMLLQMIVGGVAAVIVVTRRLWTGLLTRVSRFGRRDDKAPSDVTAHGESGK